MIVKYNDGSWYDDNEGSLSHYKFECMIGPDNYQRLLRIAHDNGMMTFDISTVINFMIENFNKKNR